MRQLLGWLWMSVLMVGVGCGIASTAMAQSSSTPPPQAVPNSLAFWSNSKNWTSNFGPAYRDTIELPSQLLACSTPFALCFHSGAEPLPCTLSPDGTSANCQCTVANETNYTLITAILNYPVYQATLQACGPKGLGCPATGSATTLCNALSNSTLIPGADVISTFDPATQDALVTAIATGPNNNITPCTKAPYAACMTAPCVMNSDGSTATCKCPVFYGKFQLIGPGAQCSLGGNLVPSAAYVPELDVDRNN